MIRLYAAAFFLLAFEILRAQTLIATPGVLLDCEAAPAQATECLIYVAQPGGPDTLRLKWRRIELTTPAGWDYDLCDYGQCYIGVPAQGEMWPATGGATPYLKIIVQPGSAPGAGWLAFRVSEAANPDNYIDLYFSPHTPGVVATNTPVTARGAIRAFPNPASDFMVLENAAPAPIGVRLLNVAGQIVWQQELAGNTRHLLDLGMLPAGLYSLQSGTGSQLIVKQ